MKKIYRFSALMLALVGLLSTLYAAPAQASSIRAFFANLDQSGERTVSFVTQWRIDRSFERSDIIRDFFAVLQERRKSFDRPAPATQDTQVPTPPPTHTPTTEPTAVQPRSTPPTPPVPAATITPPTHPASTISKGTPPMGSGFVSLNFDDGWSSAYRRGASILDAAGMQATFYITTRRLGFTNFMKREEVQDLARRGHEIGAHTLTHQTLTSLSTDELYTEIVESKKDLADMGITATTFAYPFGLYDQRAVQIVQDHFQGARGTERTFNEPGQNPYILKSVSLQRTTPVTDILSLIDEAVRNNVWLILVFHRIDEQTTDTYNTYASDLQQIVDHLKRNTIPVHTVAEGLRII